jgi:hypothetical protein
MVIYSNGKIYKITSINTDMVYIGSTTQLLCKRLAVHVSDYNRNLNGKCNKKLTSFEIIILEDYKIELVEKYPCNDKEELLAREGYWIKNTQNCVNKCVAGRTDKQYRDDNKKEIAEKNKQYYDQHKEVIAEKKKQHYEDNKEVIAEKNKQHYEDNKEVIAEKHKKYYDANKEVIAEKNKQKIECTCGKIYTLRHKARHERSKKHQEFINNQ